MSKAIKKVPLLKPVAAPKAKSASKAINLALAKTAPTKAAKETVVKPLAGKAVAIPSFKPPAMPTAKK